MKGEDVNKTIFLLAVLALALIVLIAFKWGLLNEEGKFEINCTFDGIGYNQSICAEIFGKDICAQPESMSCSIKGNVRALTILKESGRRF